ncbi:MAG: GYD domain-containing protein [Deltaproteobacteria bacterium]|nr:GYD domain-containing protein [Deltaproteobacteria bacterium]MBW2070465.1 GYD domain-containing protein [Deltaproteobacteria bacterium]
MPRYVILAKLTDDAIRAVKIAPKRIDKAIKNLEDMGGKLISFYATMGEYDYVAIGEAPNDEVAMAFLLRLGASGDVRTTTLRAFSRDELAELVKKLP